jgi:2-polyprenyl-3-methyl-5-hydroxy-6-metoxy-1,4-benzoquinol methylase
MGGEIYEYSKMKNIEKCPICEKKDFNFLFNGDDKLLGIPGTFSLFECKNCKLIFLNPQPDYSDLVKYYSNEKYYSLKKIDTISKKLKIKIFLYKTYFDEKDKNLFLRALLSPLKFLIRGTRIVYNSNLLDIGSGSGQFLYEMKKFNMNVAGVEPGNLDKAGNKKYNLNIKNSDLISAKYQENFFDIITMNHVLEHLNNPNEVLLKINRIMKKKGVLIIGIPNTNSISKKIFDKNWLALDVPRHLFNYSDKNIKFLLEKNGFKITKIRYNSRPNQFVVSLFFALGIKKRDGILNKILNIFFLPLTWIVNALKIGDQIEVWCSKK